MFLSLLLAVSTLGGIATLTYVNNDKAEKVSAVGGYTNGDGATYYNGISDSLTGDSLLSSLRSLNGSKRQATIGYNSLPNYFAQTDPGSSTGLVTSFYSGKSGSYSGNMNREHVWPDSRGGNKVEADIHMPRPTFTNENGSRGNSFYVEGMKHSSNGWDPAMESFGVESYRGDSARIIFYCVVASNQLSLVDTTNDNQNNNTMGKLSDLLKWNINYPVQNREKVRNEAAEKLQGNRNPFIDHPEYACKIWGNYNNATKSICSNAVYPDQGHVASIRIYDGYNDPTTDSYSHSVEVDESFIVLPYVDGAKNQSVSWDVDDYTVLSTNYYTGNGLTVTARKEGTATITMTYNYDDNGKSKSAVAELTITVREKGSEVPASFDNAVLVDSVSKVKNDDKVVLTTSFTTEHAKGVAGASTKDATVDEDRNQWKQFVVKNVSPSGFNLYDAAAEQYIASPGGNEFKYSTTAGLCTVNEDGVLVCNDRFLCMNGSNYRFYGSIGSYKPFYVYKISSSSSSETKTLASIEVSYSGGSVAVNEEIDTSKITVTAHYSDSTSGTVTGWNLSETSWTTAGSKTVTVSYTLNGITKTTTFNITVVGGSTPVSNDGAKITFTENVTDFNIYVDSVNSNEKITGLFAKNDGSNAPKYYDSGSSIRMYPNNSLKVSCNKTNMTSIKFTFASGENNNEITPSVGTLSSNVWTGSSQEVTFTVGGSSGHRRISAIEVFYYDSNSFATEFLANITCTGQGGTTFSNSTWNTMSSKYDGLFSADKNLLKTALADVNGNNVSKAMARYDYIVSKYEGAFANFIGRNISPIQSNFVIDNQQSYSLIVILIISSSLVTTFVGLWFLQKNKKKEDK